MAHAEAARICHGVSKSPARLVSPRDSTTGGESWGPPTRTRSRAWTLLFGSSFNPALAPGPLCVPKFCESADCSLAFLPPGLSFQPSPLLSHYNFSDSYVWLERYHRGGKSSQRPSHCRDRLGRPLSGP